MPQTGDSCATTLGLVDERTENRENALGGVNEKLGSVSINSLLLDPAEGKHRDWDLQWISNCGKLVQTGAIAR